MEALVRHVQKSFVLLEWPSQGSAEYIPLKLRDCAVIEEVARVQRTVAQKFVCAAMNAICARSSDDIDLRAGTLAVFGAIRVFYNGKFSDRIHTQELAAGSSRSVVNLRSPRIFHAVEQIKILLGSASGCRKHVAHDRVRSADASRPLRCIVHDSGIERDQLVVTAAVQRQILHLAIANQPGGFYGGYIGGNSGLLHLNALLQFRDR